MKFNRIMLRELGYKEDKISSIINKVMSISKPIEYQQCFVEYDGKTISHALRMFDIYQIKAVYEKKLSNEFLREYNRKRVQVTYDDICELERKLMEKEDEKGNNRL